MTRAAVAMALVALLLPGAAAWGARVQDLPGQVWLKPPVGGELPPDLSFTDSTGRRVALGEFRGRPMLLALVAYRCPNLCPQMLLHLVQGLNGIGPTAGADFSVVTVSIDPREGPADAAFSRTQCLHAYRRPGAQWHALIGGTPAIRRIEEAVGFRAVWDESHQEFAHALGVLVITPKGRISHCFTGSDFSPADLGAALQDAEAENITPMPDQTQQYCATYDMAATNVGRAVIRWLRVGGIVTVGLLAGYILRSLVAERRAKARQGQGVGA